MKKYFTLFIIIFSLFFAFSCGQESNKADGDSDIDSFVDVVDVIDTEQDNDYVSSAKCGDLKPLLGVAADEQSFRSKCLAISPHYTDEMNDNVHVCDVLRVRPLSSVYGSSFEYQM